MEPLAVAAADAEPTASPMTAPATLIGITDHNDRVPTCVAAPDTKIATSPRQARTHLACRTHRAGTNIYRNAVRPGC